MVLERNVEGAARQAEDLRWLSAYLRGILDTEEISGEDLALILRHVYERLRDEGDERTADLILDGLDLLTGWCGPGMAVRQRRSA